MKTKRSLTLALLATILLSGCSFTYSYSYKYSDGIDTFLLASTDFHGDSKSPSNILDDACNENKIAVLSETEHPKRIDGKMFYRYHCVTDEKEIQNE